MKASIRAAATDLKFIKIYNSAIDEILKSIETVINKLHGEYGILDENERFSCMRRISSVFNSIDDLHSQLRFIHGEWTIPETYIFVKNLFKSILKNDNDISIVLSDEYMFEEADMSSYLESKINSYYIQANISNIRPTLFLPKIENTNPLNWTILVHEMGHVLNKPLKRIFSDKEIKEISTSADGIKMLEYWTEEVWCDLIASKLLGPAYLASYIAFSLLLASSIKIEGSSSTHPADRFRISIMKAFLQKNSMELELECNYSGENNIVNLFDNFFEDRCEFERDNNIYDQSPISQFPINFQKFRDFIIEKIDTLTHKELPYFKLNNKKIKVLTERLSDGFIIGSSVLNQDTENTLDKLNEIDDIMKDKENHTNQKERIKNLMKIVIDVVKERPNHIGDIINAGWKYKCEKYYSKMLDLLFCQSNDINYCFNIFRNEVSLLDEKLTKSIEISYIHNLFIEEA